MIEVLLAGLAGLLIGSFLNVCIFRLPLDLSVVSPSRSYCPQCEGTIAWFDNIPVLSFVMLRGRCRKCRARISLRYPLVERLTCAAFALAVVRFGPTLEGLKMCVFAAICITLIFTDIEERILPDEFTKGGTVVGVLFAFAVLLPVGFMSLLVPATWGPRLLSVAEAAFAAAFASGTLGFVGYAYSKVRNREGLGLGDVNMVAMIGSFLGLMPTLLSLMMGSVLGAVGGLIFIWLKKEDASTYELPFGSFLGVAALLAGYFART